MKKKQLLGSVLLVVTAIIWGTAFAFQRSGMEHIEPITFAASRMTLAAVSVGIVSLFIGRDNSADHKKQLSYHRNNIIGGICCGCFLIFASIFQQIGIVYTTAGKAGFITGLYMLFVPIISFMFFKKKNTWLVWLSVVLGIAGMYVLCMSESFSLSYGDGLECICALLFSGHILCCDHFASKGNPVRISAVQFIVAAAISWIAAFILETPSWDNIVSAMQPILYCGIVSGGMGYTFQIVAQKYTQPTIAALIMSLESVFAAIAGAVILDEKMSVRELIGCIIIFTAIVLVQIPLPGKNREIK